MSGNTIENRENAPIPCAVSRDETATERDRGTVRQEIGAVGKGGTDTSLWHTNGSCEFPW
jgi:hypothetical protein